MKKQPARPSRRRTRGVVLGSLAAGVALTSAFALTGGTPSSAYEAVFAPEKTSEISGTVAELPAPAASKNPAAPDSATGPAGSLPGKAPKASEGVGVAPPKPAADDAELGRTPQKKNKPVKLTDAVQVLDGITVGIANLAAVQGVADEPGEVAGDAVKVSVTLTNTGTTPVDTSGVLVDLEAGPEAIPGLALRGAGATTFPPSIEPGGSATADYVFVVDSTQRARVSVLVNYSVSAPVAVFEGTAPPAKGTK
jgi:hypothetical protein